MVNWDQYFELERQVRDLARKAGLPKHRASWLAARVACRPRLPRSQAVRLLARLDLEPLLALGTPAVDHPLVVQAWRIVERYAPGLTPPLSRIRIRETPADAVTVGDVIAIDPRCPQMRSAERGNPLPLAAVIVHEAVHARYPSWPERCACNVEDRFLEKYS
jgi:hypothetical protein